MKRRWQEHKKHARAGLRTTHLYNSMSKYGIENFLFEQIEEIPQTEVDEREKFWILKLAPAYNKTDGGGGSAGSFHRLTPEKQNEIRERMRKTTQTPKWREKHKLAQQKLSQDSEYKAIMQKMYSGSDWKEKHAAGIRKLKENVTWKNNVTVGARSRSQDPSWRAKNKKANQKRGLGRLQIFTKDGELCKVYESISSFANEHGCGNGQILKLAISGKPKRSGKFKGCTFKLLYSKDKDDEIY